MVNSGRLHAFSACSNSSEVSCCCLLLAKSEATVFLLSLSPMEAFEAFFFSAEATKPEAVEVSAAAMAAPAFSLFISKAACIAEKL